MTQGKGLEFLLEAMAGLSRRGVACELRIAGSGSYRGQLEETSAALGLNGAVQFLESYIITPMVEDRALSMPPAVLLSAQILMGLAAGILGVLLASPLAVVVIVLVQILYVRGVLGHDVQPLGSNGSAPAG